MPRDPGRAWKPQWDQEILVTLGDPSGARGPQ